MVATTMMMMMMTVSTYDNGDDRMLNTYSIAIRYNANRLAAQSIAAPP